MKASLITWFDLALVSRGRSRLVMLISKIAMEIVLLVDSWRAGGSDLLELLTGVSSNFDAMMIEIVGEAALDIVLLRLFEILGM